MAFFERVHDFFATCGNAGSAWACDREEEPSRTLIVLGMQMRMHCDELEHSVSCQAALRSCCHGKMFRTLGC